jgi:uncharacterized protein (TIGR02611 family)
MKVRLSAVRKIIRTIIGFLVLIIGIILTIPGVPGPGVALILLGLVILSAHFHWARRSVEWVKRKAEQAKQKARSFRSKSDSQT